MSKENLHNDFETFRNYYTGKMSPEEKSNFENSLEKDPFAKDAYEGFLLLENDFDRISAIENSNMKIKEFLGLETSKAIFPIKTFVAIAASLVVLLGSYFFISTNFYSNNKENSIAENNIKKQEKVIEEEPEEPKIDEVVVENDNVSDSTINNDTFTIKDVEQETYFYNVDVNKDETKLNDKIENTKVSNLEREEKVLNGNKSSKQKKQINFDDYYKNNDKNTEVEAEEIIEEGRTSTTDVAPISVMNTVVYDDSELKESTEKQESNISEYKKGIAAYNKSEYVKAIKFFNNSLNKNKSISHSNFYIGMSYFNQGKHSKAIKYFDKVLNTSLKNKAEWYKALSLLNKGNRTEGIKLLNKIANSDSVFSTAALNKLNNL